MISNKVGGKKIRKSPTESATKFKVGIKRLGNDGNMWIVGSTISGIHRWQKISKEQKSIKPIIKKFTNISLEKLKQMKKKYNVTTNGTKKDIAYGLWRVSGHTMTSKDLALISYLLPKKDQKIIEKQIKVRSNRPITNFKGMWKPKPKSLSKMSRLELIRNLRLFRNAWERITARNQDLSNERLASETTDQLRKLIQFYYSNDAKLIAEDWLRKAL